MPQEVEGKVEILNQQTTCPRDVAMARIKYLESGLGFPSFVLSIFRESVKKWLVVLSMDEITRGANLEQREESMRVKLLLLILKRIAMVDSTLDEELAKEGSHVMLAKIINVDCGILNKEADQDFLMEMQDIACEIASMSSSFPIRISPFTNEELAKRLPLLFDEAVESHGRACVLINQVNIRQSAQKDVGFVMWPSAVALSRWLLCNTNELEGKDILELGAGCGLTGLMAARLTLTHYQTEAKKIKVIITDFNEVVVKNINQNIHLNAIEKVAKGARLDFYQQDPTREGWLDTAGKLNEQVDIVLAADVICQPDDAYAAARSIKAALRNGGKAVVVSGDSKHRYGVDCFEDACTCLGLGVTKCDVRDIYEGNLISPNMEKTSGYVDSMSLLMFIVEKISEYENGES
eukprot:CAMPEP_0178934686 /NCGR_PEP_ID=MMETSP0786-20121207/24024_1 /TAXON_ID=186022 /ORGANISM="Thalassionema frauenfeldii, Strain CCMP 1798" /LENGTH=406 /DNA_ID=CAMNT_0020612543 /DNA_START=92 /DNA_END=1312 /DNA_ORIENTATION=+